MRTTFAIIFMILIVALGVCVYLSKRSRKAIGTSVALLMGSLIMPVIGNLIIIASGSELLQNDFEVLHFNTNVMRVDTAFLYGLAVIKHALTEFASWHTQE